MVLVQFNSIKPLRPRRARGLKPKSNSIQPTEPAASDAKKNQPRLIIWLNDFWAKKGRKEKFAYLILGILAAGVAAWFWVYCVYGQPAPAIVAYVPHGKPKPKTVPSPLTGVQVSPKLAARPVTAIMVENSLDARPQSGLQDAGIVFEAIAEGGVTRFVALYQDAAPQYIGPVRSLRPYFLDFAAPFQASIAHVGGSPDALARVRNGHYRDIDQFFNSGYYWRVSTRYAPHNVYTSFSKLDALNSAKGYKSSKFTPWPRKPDKKTKHPTAASIDIKISGPIYYVHYDYDSKANRYSRSEGGAKHMDIIDAAGRHTVQLKPKVVIAMAIPRSYGALDASGAYYTDYQDVGSGRAYVFQDGGVASVIWKKTSSDAPLQFFGGDGQPYRLDAGQTWITAIDGPSQLVYKP